MKHLRRFNESHINTDEIKNYIDDILSDIDEYNIKIQSCKDISVLYFDVVKNHLEFLYHNDDITEIIEISIHKKYENDSLTYENIKEQSGSLVSYMLSEGFDYIIDPVWKNSVGIGYKLSEISEIENIELISLNFRFFQ